MANSTLHPQGWISVIIPTVHEQRAQRMRAERDRQYGNIYVEADTDERWVGDLGEKAFDSWLKHEGVVNCRWILDNAAGKPDFITAKNKSVGVKTVKRKVSPRVGYTAQITARHASEPIDYFFFLTYEFKQHRMWLLGGIDKQTFLREARYYAAGERVHENYQIRPGHEIYNIELTKLIPPQEWLGIIK